MRLQFTGSRDKALETRDEDRLALSYYADGLAEFIGSCQAPMTIGVQGEWGSGKTSLMKLVRAELRRRSTKDFPAIIDHWFDTWQYGAVGNADILGVRLLQDLTDEIRKRGKEDDMALFRAADNVWRAARQIAPGVARAVTVGAASTATRGLVDAATLSASLPGSGGELNVSSIRKHFGDLVAKIVQDQPRKNARVVVFIDDLDRIRPGRAVALLEILKNFMDVDDTIFVVACDYDVVLEGVKELMGIESPAKVQAFFHKIFQVPFEMPCASYSVQPMLREWLVAKVGTSGIGAELAADHTSLVEAALGTNPRALKRFLNTVDLQCAVDAAYPESQAASATPASRHLVRVQQWKGDGLWSWVASMLGLFALQSSWPEVADYILYDALGEPDAAAARQRFERALRTLSRDWTGWTSGSRGVEANEVEEPDEQLQALLRRTYGGSDLDLDWKHPRVEQLCDFAVLWFAALDRQSRGAGSNQLCTEEVSRLWRWSQRTVVQRGSGARRRGRWAFMELARQISPPHADAFLGLLDSIEQWCGPSPVLSSSYNRGGLTVHLRGTRGQEKPFMKFLVDKKKLLIKVLVPSPSVDVEFGLDGFSALVEPLTRCFEGEGFKCVSARRYLDIHFESRQKDGDAAQMDRLMNLFKQVLDGAASLRRLQVSLKPAKDDSPADHDAVIGTSSSQPTTSMAPVG